MCDHKVENTSLTPLIVFIVLFNKVTLSLTFSSKAPLLWGNIRIVIFVITRNPKSMLKMTGNIIKEFLMLVYFFKKHNVSRQNKNITFRHYWIIQNPFLVI